MKRVPAASRDCATCGLPDMAGVAVETAIRLLSAFHKEGLISMERRSITLLSQDRLARIAKL